MFAIRPYQRGVRDTLWLATMAILAAAIMLMISVKLAGGAQPQPPQFLPELVVEWQEAVNQFRDGNFIEARDRMQTVQDQVVPWMPIELRGQRAMGMWNVLTLQARGQLELATIEWERVELPGEMRAWKHVAIAAMHLERARHDEAAEEIAKAQLLDPDNPVVHYYLGVLHLQQAEEAIEWPDYVRTPTFRFVAYTQDVVPNTKGMYQLAATRDLEHAVESAGCIDRNFPLIPMEWATEPMLCPTINDVLLAMGATDFESNAHHMLGYLFLERGALEVAEEHLDRANDLGATVPFVFSDLGEQYETAGRHHDAARAYLKAIRNGPDRAGAMMRFFQNVGDSVREGL